MDPFKQIPYYKSLDEMILSEYKDSEIIREAKQFVKKEENLCRKGENIENLSLNNLNKSYLYNKFKTYVEENVNLPNNIDFLSEQDWNEIDELEYTVGKLEKDIGKEIGKKYGKSEFKGFFKYFLEQKNKDSPENGKSINYLKYLSACQDLLQKTIIVHSRINELSKTENEETFENWLYFGRNIFSVAADQHKFDEWMLGSGSFCPNIDPLFFGITIPQNKSPATLLYERVKETISNRWPQFFKNYISSIKKAHTNIMGYIEDFIDDLEKTIRKEFEKENYETADKYFRDLLITESVMREANKLNIKDFISSFNPPHWRYKNFKPKLENSLEEFKQGQMKYLENEFKSLDENWSNILNKFTGGLDNFLIYLFGDMQDGPPGEGALKIMREFDYITKDPVLIRYYLDQKPSKNSKDDRVSDNEGEQKKCDVALDALFNKISSIASDDRCEILKVLPFKRKLIENEEGCLWECKWNVVNKYYLNSSPSFTAHEKRIYSTSSPSFLAYEKRIADNTYVYYLNDKAVDDTIQGLQALYDHIYIQGHLKKECEKTSVNVNVNLEDLTDLLDFWGWLKEDGCADTEFYGM